MDVEGCEVAAIRGAITLLSKFDYPPIFLEVNSYTLALQGETQLSLCSTLCDLGYIPYEIVDNTLVPYNIHHLADRMFRDLLFIKEMRCQIVYPIVTTTFASKSEIAAQITRQLSHHREWQDACYDITEPESCADYICLALRDYPEYYNMPQINELLSEIADRADKYPLLKSMLGWFKAKP
jgi:hypothetical protein